MILLVFRQNIWSTLIVYPCETPILFLFGIKYILQNSGIDERTPSEFSLYDVKHHIYTLRPSETLLFSGLPTMI